ncbi:MAG: hypothetical protein QM680_09855 [Luteolibacter sp.]
MKFTSSLISLSFLTLGMANAQSLPVIEPCATITSAELPAIVIGSICALLLFKRK